jgi:hypothetical protein
MSQQEQVCWGCEHVHLDGRDKPCACGCSGFIRSMTAWNAGGCDNPNCPECLADGRHQPATTNQGDANGT